MRNMLMRCPEILLTRCITENTSVHYFSLSHPYTWYVLCTPIYKHIHNFINKITFKESLNGVCSYISASPVSRCSGLSLHFLACKTLGKWRVICITISGDFREWKDWNTSSSGKTLLRDEDNPSLLPAVWPPILLWSGDHGSKAQLLVYPSTLRLLNISLFQLFSSLPFFSYFSNFF